jgi:hypothetical protein
VARGRRGGDESPVSFFSFQDVMMCTIGITIITTMILVLQLGRVAAQHPQMSLNESEDAELTRLVAAQDALSKQLSEEELDRDIDADRKLASEVVTIVATAEELERMKKEVLAARDELEKLVRTAGADDRALLALELMRRRDELQDELKDLSNRRRIVYLVAPSEPLAPIVTEVSSGRVVMSTDQSREAPLSIPSSDAESAARAIIAVFKSTPTRERRYLLLVLKPSGIPTYLRLRELLNADPETRGVRVGLDLIPEDYWTTDEFPGSQQPAKGGTP